MRYILIILAFFTFSFTLGDDSDRLRLFSDSDTYDWKDCVVPSNKYIQSQAIIIRKHFNEYIANMDSIERYLHFIDFNNDGKLDVIYSGTTGAAADFVVFLLKMDNDYIILYTEYTNIRELIFKDKKLVGYTGLDLGCCAEYLQKETKYLISDNWQRTVIYQRVKTNYTELPQNIYNKPINFVVAKDVYKLRSSPMVNDTGYVIYDTIGNVVSTYIKGSIGRAWADKLDSTGRVWWFVEMEPNNRQIGSKLNTKSDTLPMRNLGWMSSRYLEKK